MKHAFILFTASCLFTGSNSQAIPAKSPLAITAATSINASLGTYTGTIPCADCQGIAIELTLQEGKTKQKTFVLKQKYLGKPENQSTFTTTGIWFIANGNKQNPKAKVLQLIPDGKDELLYFELQQDGNLKMLDRRQNSIKSKLNYTLKKKRA